METTNALFSWYAIARRELGVKELRGIADNPRIVQYHAVTTLRATDDEVPWCSSFVCFVMQTAGYKHTRSAAARSWLQYGTRLQNPVEGCIVVMSRPGGNHVGFFAGFAANGFVKVLGGNQDNAVNVKNFMPNRILAYILPNPLNTKDGAVLQAIQLKS